MIEITKEKFFEHFEIFLRDCMKQEKLMQQSAFSHFSSVVYRKILLLLGEFYFLLGQFFCSRAEKLSGSRAEKLS